MEWLLSSVRSVRTIESLPLQVERFLDRVGSCTPCWTNWGADSGRVMNKWMFMNLSHLLLIFRGTLCRTTSASAASVKRFCLYSPALGQMGNCQLPITTTAVPFNMAPSLSPAISCPLKRQRRCHCMQWIGQTLRWKGWWSRGGKQRDCCCNSWWMMSKNEK